MTPKQLREYIDARTKPEGACRIWTGAYSGSGQPMMWFKGKRRTVKSVVLEALKGVPQRPGFVSTTVCECIQCVDTSHCQQVSQAQMLERSRKNTNQALRAARIAASQAHLRKLTDEDILTILTSSEPGVHLAKRLGVHHSLISKYRRSQPGTARAINPLSGLGARA